MIRNELIRNRGTSRNRKSTHKAIRSQPIIEPKVDTLRIANPPSQTLLKNFTTKLNTFPVSEGQEDHFILKVSSALKILFLKASAHKPSFPIDTI